MKLRAASPTNTRAYSGHIFRVAFESALARRDERIAPLVLAHTQPFAEIVL